MRFVFVCDASIRDRLEAYPTLQNADAASPREDAARIGRAELCVTDAESVSEDGAGAFVSDLCFVFVAHDFCASRLGAYFSKIPWTISETFPRVDPPKLGFDDKS